MDLSTHRKTTVKRIGRDLPDGTHLVIEIEERDNTGTLSPGFAVTVDGYDRHGTRTGRQYKAIAKDIDFGGCCHDLVLQAAPELAPVVAVHLANQDGVPMHAVANGWYFYTGKARKYEIDNYGQEYADRHGTNHERAAAALNIPPADLPEGLDKEGFEEFAASLSERWLKMAQEARKVMDDIDDGEGL